MTSHSPLGTKRPWLAFVLSLLLPGAGLAYAGYRRLAVLNLLVAVLLLVSFVLLWPRETLFDWLHYLLLVVGAASGGLAHVAAGLYNRGVNSWTAMK